MDNLENRNRIIEMGGKEWTKGGKERVYINNAILNTLRDEQGLSAVNFGERNNKLFFDITSNQVLRSYKRKAPQLELTLGERR